jgi:ribosome biogenesis protein Nip4
MAVYEGEIEWHAEDGGKALIVEAVSDLASSVSVTLTSWNDEHSGIGVNRYDINDLARLHPELAGLIAGKVRLRITVEALD